MIPGKNRPIILFLITIAFCNIGFCGKFIYPWNATTEIVKAGNNFDICFNADINQTVNSAALRGPFCVRPIPVSKIETGSWVYDTISGNSYNTRITASAPTDMPADRYDLVLNTSTGQEISRRSVKVIKQYKTEFSIMHISDPHMCQGKKINGHPERLFKISTLADISNIIGTEMVFVTGDLINHNMFSPRERAEFFYNGCPRAGLKGMHGFNAATFAVAGNHDFQEGQLPGTGHYPQKAQLWNNCHGLHYHHFAYGNTRCMTVNNGWNGFDWSYQLEDHLGWLKNAGPGNFRLAAYHKSELGIMGDWATKIDLNLAMIGHNHHLAKDNPYELGRGNIQYYADSIREHVSFNLFRIHGDGTFSVQNNQDFVENPDDDYSLWKPKLTLKYTEPNDGTVHSNIVTLTNQFDFGFPDARVRFVMPKGVQYAVSQGTIQQTFEGDSVRIVDIVVPVNADSTVSIAINPIRQKNSVRWFYMKIKRKGQKVKKQCFFMATLFLLILGCAGCHVTENTSVSAEENALPPKVKFRFIVAADPQLFRGKKEDLDKAIEKINDLNPDFVIMCGDLIETPANLQQIQAYKDSVSKLSPEIELYNIPGNHDLGRPAKIENIQVYQQHFGKLWYHFEYKNNLFIGLSSDVLQNDNLPMKKQQRKWLIKLLNRSQPASHKQIFVFMHHPLYLKSPDEPDAYSNMPIKIRKDLLDIFVRHSVQAVFSGHYHDNKINTCQGVDLITTNSVTVPMGNVPAGFRVVNVYKNRYEQYYFNLKQMAKKDVKQ